MATETKTLQNYKDTLIETDEGRSKVILFVRGDGSLSNGIDGVSGHQTAIDSAHAHIHEGEGYTTEHNAAGASGTKATITFTTPSGSKLIHLITHARSNVEAFYTLGEGPTITADTGTNKAPTARNRSNIVASIVIGTRTATANNITFGATVSDFGTILEQLHFGLGKIGGEDRADDEWILKPSTTYALEIESQANSSEIFIEADWYEHTTVA